MNRRVFIWVPFFCWLLCPGESDAASHISGDIHAIEFNKSFNPYIVEKDIIVPEGKDIVIPAGCVFLFQAFTGLQVHGRVRVMGTAEEPVVFSSIFDSEFNPESSQLPNPFDWNGILVAQSSNGSYFNNFNLCYSVYGIKSQSRNVVIQNCLFRQNGQFHFTVFDKIQYVQDNIPYSYNKDEGPAVAGTASGPGTSKKSAENAAPGGRTGCTTKIVRFTCLGIGIAATGLGTAFSIRAEGKSRELEDIESNLSAGDNHRWNDIDSQRKQSTVGAVVSFGIAVLGFTGFGISFAF